MHINITVGSTLSIDASISLIEQSGPGILAESCLSLIVVTITNIIFNPVTYCSFRRYPLLGSASFGLKAVWCRHHQQGSSRWHCNPRIRCSISDQNRRAQESMTPMSLQHLHKLVTYTTILLGYSNSKSFDFNLCLNPGRGTLITLDIHATFGSAAKVAFAQVMGTASLVSPQRMGTWNPIRIQVKQGNWNTIIWTKQNRANTNKHVW